MLHPAVLGQREREERDRARPGPLLRTMLGAVLRRTRREQRRTLADVAASARVSMQYLSELERGRKEASSEVLAAVCAALGLDLLDLLAAAWRAVAQERAAAAQMMPLRRVGFAPPSSASAGAASAGAAVAPSAPGAAAPTASAGADSNGARPAAEHGGADRAADARAETLAAAESELRALVIAAVQQAADAHAGLVLADISWLSGASSSDPRAGGEQQSEGSRPPRIGEIICQLAA
jgi:transcriptional regulator with XRE-family HTH domain